MYMLYIHNTAILYIYIQEVCGGAFLGGAYYSNHRCIYIFLRYVQLL